MELARYREWDGVPRPPWLAATAIVRVGLRLILRRWLFWLLIGLGLMHFLLYFAIVYVKATLSAQFADAGRFLDQYKLTGSGQAYADFMLGQASITALLLAFAGSTLIGGDYRQGGMVFYLSRRIDRWHYILGKLLTVAAIVTLITTLPALILYVQYGMLTNSLEYFTENPRILVGILGYGLVLAVVQSSLLFAIAAWVPRTVPLVMTWLGIFVLLPALGMALRQINGNRHWLLLGFWEDMHRLGRWCFGSFRDERPPTVTASALVLAGLCLVSLLLIVRRVRAVEVVR